MVSPALAALPPFAVTAPLELRRRGPELRWKSPLMYWEHDVSDPVYGTRRVARVVDAGREPTRHVEPPLHLPVAQEARRIQKPASPRQVRDALAELTRLDSSALSTRSG